MGIKLSQIRERQRRQVSDDWKVPTLKLAERVVTTRQVRIAISETGCGVLMMWPIAMMNYKEGGFAIYIIPHRVLVFYCGDIDIDYLEFCLDCALSGSEYSDFERHFVPLPRRQFNNLEFTPQATMDNT